MPASTPTPISLPVFSGAWRRIREFSALAGGATYLWPRWLLLRAIGAVYVIIFAGIIVQSRTLISPDGIAPLAVFFGVLKAEFSSVFYAFFRAPGLFWLGTSMGLIAAMAWGGLIAAVALTLNLWPRMALFGCWLFFLSFVTTGRFFAATQPDQLMIEAALICIPLAPAGLRPRLGAQSPPRPIAIFMVRWFLFRVMFEAGVLKLVAGDAHWRNFTAMDVMYETTPFPTILGYFDHQLPHAYHVFECLLTFAAEIAAPLLAVFAGRRGRWAALGLWVVFQAGIELTNNFGWLNLAAGAFGIVLLDDQMLAAAAKKLGFRRRAGFPASAAPVPAIAPGRLWGLRAALGTYFFLTVYFAWIPFGLPANAIPATLARWVNFAFGDFHSSNVYPLFQSFPPGRYDLEFLGSNDDGATWRPYEFRYQPQKEDRICPFIAPWYPRFEATLEITFVSVPHAMLFPAVATHLLAGDRRVIGLFQRDPFPDRPPTMIRMPVYRLTFTDFKTYRRTGRFWNKEYEGDYMPRMYRDEHGRIGGGE